jgi:hypothetical protein
LGECKARAGVGFKHSHDILFQQVDRHRQEYGSIGFWWIILFHEDYGANFTLLFPDASRRGNVMVDGLKPLFSIL